MNGIAGDRKHGATWLRSFFGFEIYPLRIHPIKREVEQKESSGIIIRKAIFRILFFFIE